MSPKDVCQAKADAITITTGRPAKTCGFGRPNPNNPEVCFTGCPACHNAAEDPTTTLDKVLEDMVGFMTRLTAVTS